HLVTSHILTVTGEVTRPGEPCASPPKDASEESQNNDGDIDPKHMPVSPLLLVEERRVGPFTRVFFFPAEVDTDKEIDARLEGGLLTLKIQKKHAPRWKTQQVEVKES